VAKYKEPTFLSDEELTLISDGPRINEEERWIQWRDKDGEFVASDDPAFLAAPIKAEDGSVLGVLRAPAVGTGPTWGGETFFDFEDLRVFQSFADSVALFLQNMRRKDLSDMLIELSAILDEESLFQFVVDRTPMLVRARGCSILLMKPHRKEKPLVLSYTNSHWLKQASGEVITLEYDLGEGKSGFVASTGMSLVINYYGSGEIQLEKLDADFEHYRQSPRNLVAHLLNAEGRRMGLIRLVGDGVQAVLSEFQEFVRRQQLVGEGKEGLPSPHGNRCETGPEQDSISFLAVPIKDERGQVQGIIRLPRTDTGGNFSDEDLSLLESIANRLTLTLRSLALLQSNLERSEKLERLALSFENLIGQLWDEPLERRLERIVESAADILGAEICSLWQVLRPGHIQLVAAHGNIPGTDRTESGDPIELPIRSGIGVGLTGHIAAGSQTVRLHGEALRGHYAVRRADHQPHIASGKCYSLLGIPLTREVIREDSRHVVETIGLLKAENKRDEEGNPNPLVEFTQEDEAISIIIAKTVVTILDNAQYVQELESLQRVGIEVTGLLTLDRVLPMLLERLREILSTEYARIQLDDPQLGLVQIEAGPHPPHAQLRAFPIKVRDEEIGKLEVDRVSPHESQTLARFITQAAVAIRNAQLFEQAESQRQRLESLAKVSAHLLEFTDRERLFKNLVKSAGELLSAEECSLFLVDPLGQVELKASSLREVKSSDAQPARVGTEEGIGLVGYVAATSEALNFANGKHLDHPAWSSQDAQYLACLPSGESHSVLLVPIRRPDEPPIGVFKVENKVGPNSAHGFLGNEELLSTLANQAVIAVRNVDLYASTEGALQRQVDKLVALREIDRSITLLDHLNAILDVIVDKAVSLSRSRANTALIALRCPEEAGLVVKACCGDDTAWKDDLLEERSISQALGGQQVRQRDKLTGHWKLAAPLWRKDEICGIVAMACAGREEGLDEDLRWLESLAGQAAIAVEREDRRQALARVEEEKDAAAQMLLISGFSSIFAHNTANVIGTIPLDVDHLRELVDPENEEIKEALDDIHLAAERMLAMSLEMRRPDHHERRAVNLGELLDEAKTHANPPDRIDAQIVGAESAPQVYVPPLSVREVFANILKNAAEAIAKTGADEGGKITVECSPMPDAGTVLVSISDTGCGFTEQERTQLFQPLWKLKGGQRKGMGFALWWAQKLVTAIGGRISAESPGKGKGATFRVWLPIEGHEAGQGGRA